MRDYKKEDKPVKGGSEKVINGRKDVFEHLKTFLKDFEEGQEYIILLGLNNRNGLTYCEITGMGGMDSVKIDPSVIFKRLITNNCTGFIIAHNHPSNNTSPSEEDTVFTKRMKDGGKILGIELLDHIVFASDFSGYEGVNLSED